MNITNQNEQIYNRVAELSSRAVTHKYSTSFSLSIYMLHQSIRNPICAIYGFVRLADEIVDTFLNHNRDKLLADFKKDTYRALEEGISLNPVLHHFQDTVHRFNIDIELIEAFFKSMEMDLEQQEHNRSSFDSYIYGSAEVVGLMCLRVFCDGNAERYKELKSYAVSLGAAFQKVNFLRDMKQDTLELNRHYFPQLQLGGLNQRIKTMIELEIEGDFSNVYQGIVRLPMKARFGVYVAFVYYRYLLKKIKMVPPEEIKTTRIRVSNHMKCYLLFKAMVKHKLNWM